MTTIQYKKERPFLRGKLHQVAFYCSIVGASFLILTAKNSDARMGSIVYGISLTLMFGVSSLFHCITWSPRKFDFMFRLDHAMIFIFIAGTATPVCLLKFPQETSTLLLLMFWICATIGIIKEIIWSKCPRWISVIFYLIIGWSALVFRHLDRFTVWVLSAGGVVITIGTLIYLVKKPNPFPKIFGYHEIFHLLVIIGSILHFIAIYRIVAQ